MKKKGYQRRGGRGAAHNDDEREIERGNAKAESMTKVKFFPRV